MDFGDRLKQYRMNEGLSQEQLAEKIGVSRQAITKWETKRGLPDVENMVILAEIFKMTLDELVLQETKKQESDKELFESETIYDIDCSKHFDIHMGSARKIKIHSGDDEKIHIKLQSDSLDELSSLYKVKLDERKNKLDIDFVKKKGISRYEVEEAVDVLISLPKDNTNHCEVEAAARQLYLEDLKLERLEYDGSANEVFIKDTMGSLEFTSKTDYDITIKGMCTNLDVNQFKAKSVVHIESLDSYHVLNNGRRCMVVYQKEGAVIDKPQSSEGENVISISGISSELIIDMVKG